MSRLLSWERNDTKRPWLPDEIARLAEDYRASVPLGITAQSLRRTKSSIKHKRLEMREAGTLPERAWRQSEPRPSYEREPVHPTLGDDEHAKRCRRAGGFWGLQRNDSGPVYRAMPNGALVRLGTWEQVAA